MSTYEISKSSLLSLKAEILKKQEEVNKAKYVNKARLANPVKGALELKNKGVASRASKDYEFNQEDEDLLKKSRLALEAKSKLYDKLSKNHASDADDDKNKRYLVRFGDKEKPTSKVATPMEFVDDEEDKYPESDEENYANNKYDDAENSDDEWVEYVDSFGRTRSCLKKDLNFIKAKDRKINNDEIQKVDANLEKAEVVDDGVDIISNKNEYEEQDEIQSEFNDDSEMLSADMRRELQRQKWEDEEAKLTEKTNVHYQDILFSEARNHGVGYYGFSKDEDERTKQQEALSKLRKETQEKQKAAQEIKKNREKQMSARIRAAKNRKRAREGLPPLTSDDDEEKEPTTTESIEEAPKLDTPEDKEKAVIRKLHVRPWDVGKEGVKEHYEYTQEEWVELQRNKREGEFAPPRKYKTTPRMQDLEQEAEPTQKGLYFSSKKTKTPDSFYIDTNPNHINPYKTKEYKQTIEKTDNFVATPIQDECIDFDDEYNQSMSAYDPYEDRLMQDYMKSNVISDEGRSQVKRGGVEVAPPSTYDYYGPSASKRRANEKSNVNMEDSIMEGLKFIRHKVEKIKK